MPRGVRVKNPSDGTFEVAIPFTRWRGFIAFVAALFLVAMGVLIAVMVPADGQAGGKAVGVATCVLVGLGLGYPGLAYLVNYRTIVVDKEAVAVRNGPIRWPGNFRVPAEDIKQLYVHRIVYRGQRGTDERYLLRAVFAPDGTHMTLVTFDKLKQALWSEQEIEQRLGITDIPVMVEPQP